MPFPLALIPVALSAIQSLVRFRDRVDDILALNTTSDELPFALPPPPPNTMGHLAAMLEFFGTDAGRLLLELRDLKADFAKVSAEPGAEKNFGPRQRLFDVYCDAAAIRATKAGPAGEDPRIAAKGPSTEMRLAWYVVESHRLSRNPAITRVLLAAADTLLEFGAQNAGLFIRDPRTRGLVVTLLEEFAVERDWDDASSEKIFKTLLGSAAAAVAKHGGELSDNPALGALFGALADVRDKMGDEFIENFISRPGFTQLAGFFLTRAADTPGLLPKDELARDVVATLLREAGGSFDQILDDPTALIGVLESGLAVAATQAAPLIQRKLGSRPLLAAVLKAVADKLAAAAGQHQLIATVGRGDFLGLLYDTVLRAVAARPDLLATEAKLGDFAAGLIAGVAGSLAEAGLEDAFSTGTLEKLALGALETLAEQPDMLAGNHDFAAQVLRAVLPAAAAAAKDGFSADDLLEVTNAALRAVAGNLGLVELNERLRGILEAVALTLSDAGLKQLLTAQGRKEVFLASLDAVVANPRVWAGLVTQTAEPLVQQLVQNILAGLVQDPTRLLTGPAMAEAVRMVLLVAVRRGQKLIDQETTPAAVGELLAAALARANSAIGNGIDGETLPEFLQHALDAFLQKPFPVSDAALLKALLDQVLPTPESALLLDAIETRSLHPAKSAPRRSRGKNR